MEPIVWTEEYSVGVEKIDEQHKKLIAMINRLIARPEVTTRSETISYLLTDMTRYAQEHFATEEALLRKYNYPLLEEHIAQHREFRKKTVDFCTATMLGASKVPETLLDYLHDWLLEHLLNSDIAYKSFFHERGVE